MNGLFLNELPQCTGGRGEGAQDLCDVDPRDVVTIDPLISIIKHIFLINIWGNLNPNAIRMNEIVFNSFTLILGYL